MDQPSIEHPSTSLPDCKLWQLSYRQPGKTNGDDLQILKWVSGLVTKPRPQEAGHLQCDPCLDPIISGHCDPSQVSSRPPRMHPSSIAAAPTRWGRRSRLTGLWTKHQWRCPIHGGTPVHHPLSNRSFHERNHPAIGVPQWLRKPPYMGVSEDEVHFRGRCSLTNGSFGYPTFRHMGSQFMTQGSQILFTSCL